MSGVAGWARLERLRLFLVGRQRGSRGAGLAAVTKVFGEILPVINIAV